MIWKLILLKTFWLFSHSASSNDQFSTLAQTTGILAGSAAVLNSAQVGRMTKELEDWKDESGTTGRFVYACDVQAEFRLFRGNRTNYVFAAVQNFGGELTIKWQDLVTEFESGIARRGDLPETYPPSRIAKSWNMWLLIPFPQKQDFKDQNSAIVRLPTFRNDQECILEAKIIKSQKSVISAETFSAYTAFDMSMDLGPSVGSSEQIPSSGSATLNIEFVGYRGLHHGFYWNIILDSFGTPDSNKVFSQNLLSKYEDPRVSGIGTGLGYQFRLLSGAESYSYFGAGLGLYSLGVNGKGSDGTRRQEDRFSTYSADFGIAHDWVISRAHHGIWMGDFALGLKLRASYFGAIKTQDVDYNGLHTTVLFRFRMGM